MKNENNEDSLFTPKLVGEGETVEEVKEEIKPEIEEPVNPKEEVKVELEEPKIEEKTEEVKEEIKEPEKDNDVLFHVTTDGKISDDENKEEKVGSTEIKNEIPSSEPVNATVASNPKTSGTNYLLIALPAIIILVIGAIIYFVVIKGGKKETLVCKISRTQLGITIDQTMEMSFKNGYFTNGKIHQTIDFSSYGVDIAKEFTEEKDVCEGISDIGEDGMKITGCRQEIDGSKIQVHATVELDDKLKKEKTDLKSTRDSMNSYGYSCTIE